MRATATVVAVITLAFLAGTGTYIVMAEKILTNPTDDAPVATAVFAVLACLAAGAATMTVLRRRPVRPTRADAYEQGLQDGRTGD
ncbi:hypothetical protein [Streptosporangium sp. OZ121]|uniref:hypothetical protein n=1 Tax=Streptosporangium sp. OZ121 TaxID=3444183 RepID=UPI003F78E1ED